MAISYVIFQAHLGVLLSPQFLLACIQSLLKVLGKDECAHTVLRGPSVNLLVHVKHRDFLQKDWEHSSTGLCYSMSTGFIVFAGIVHGAVQHLLLSSSYFTALITVAGECRNIHCTALEKTAPQGNHMPPVQLYSNSADIYTFKIVPCYYQKKIAEAN